MSEGVELAPIKGAAGEGSVESSPVHGTVISALVTSTGPEAFYRSTRSFRKP
jgi:hypothetical protein